MPDLDLRFVGTGNAFAPNGLCWNGFLAGGRYLFEAPPQALMSLNAMGVDPNMIEAVILSHHHGDHFLGLPFLLLHWKYQGRKTPVTVFGPPETRALTHDIGEKVYPGLFETSFEVTWIEAQPATRYTLGDLRVEPVPVQHDDRLAGSFGFAAELHGRRFAYTGDTAFCDAVVDLARGAEVLVSECASVADFIPIHMNLRDDIPRVRAAMRPESHLLLTHVGPGVSVDGMAHTTVARDFETYRF